jgi:hypothetical protein
MWITACMVAVLGLSASGREAGDTMRAETLSQAVHAVRAMPWVEEGEMFHALSALVTSGATLDEARTALPPLKGTPVLTLYNGQSFFTRYALSARYRVQISGTAWTDPQGRQHTSLHQSPRILDAQNGLSSGPENASSPGSPAQPAR